MDGSAGAAQGPRVRRLATVSAVAATLVAAGVLSAIAVGWGPFGRTSSPEVGPSISIWIDSTLSVPAGVTPASAPVGNVTVQVTGVLPSNHSYIAASLFGLSVSSNPYQEELYRGVGVPGGELDGNLLPSFYSLNQAWASELGPLTTNISLQLSATLTVIHNGTVQVYPYSNNLPFDPRAPPSSFSAAVMFSSEPTFSVHVPVPASGSASVSPDRLPPPPSCTPGYYWEPWNQTLMSNVFLPLVTVNVEGSPANSEVAYSLSYQSGTFQVSFNSATGYSSSGPTFSGVQMSTSPSASATQPGFQGITEDNAANTFQGGNPITTIGLANMNINVVNSVYDYLNSACELVFQTNEFRTLMIPMGISGSSFTFVKPVLPTWFPQVMNSMRDWGTLPPQSLPWPNGQFNLYQVMSEASGYNTASQAYQNVVDFLTTISINLGVIAAASAAAGWLPGDGDADAVACIAVIAAITGYLAGFAVMMNSISYSTTVAYSIEGYGVGNSAGGADNALTALVGADSTGSELQLPGGTYYPDMPLVYVSVT